VTTALCPVCLAEQSQSLLCNACCNRLERDLGDVAAIVADLDVTLSKMARIGNSTGPGGLARERTPINVGALECATHLRDILTGWARDVSNESWRPTDAELMVHGGQTRSAGRSLLLHINEIRRHPAVSELLDEVSDAIAQARRVVDRPADRVFVGPCMAENPDDEGRQVTCLEDLYARPQASEVRCRVCSTEHPVLERRVWLLEQARDRLFTVREAAQMMGDVGNIRVTESSIRGYIYRGRIVYHTGTLIRLGDLLAVVIDEGERRTA
jgi:hypothetical protein